MKPAFAQAKKTITCSGELPVSVATRSPRRRPRSSNSAASASERRSSSRVGDLAAEVVDRDAVRRPPRACCGASGRSCARLIARNSSTSAANSLRPLPRQQVADALEQLEPRAGDRVGDERRVAGVDDVVGRAVDDERRHADLAEPRERVVRRAGARLRVPARAVRRIRRAVRDDLVDEPVGRDRARARSRRTGACASCGSRCGRCPISATVCSRHRHRRRPAGRRRAEDELVARAPDAASTSSCAIIPPRLMPSTCARSISERVEHARARLRRAARSCTGPARSSLSPKPRLSNVTTLKRSREQRRRRPPARAAVAEPLDRAAAARPTPCDVVRDRRPRARRSCAPAAR